MYCGDVEEECFTHMLMHCSRWSEHRARLVHKVVEEMGKVGLDVSIESLLVACLLGKRQGVFLHKIEKQYGMMWVRSIAEFLQIVHRERCHLLDQKVRTSISPNQSLTRYGTSNLESDLRKGFFSRCESDMPPLPEDSQPRVGSP